MLLALRLVWTFGVCRSPNTFALSSMSVYGNDVAIGAGWVFDAPRCRGAGANDTLPFCDVSPIATVAFPLPPLLLGVVPMRLAVVQADANVFVQGSRSTQRVRSVLDVVAHHTARGVPATVPTNHAKGWV